MATNESTSTIGGETALLELTEKPGVAEAQQYSKLMEHAIDTFGSEETAREWLSIECGALNNQSPNNFIRGTGNLAEVDRILTCLDYGMIA